MTERALFLDFPILLIFPLLGGDKPIYSICPCVDFLILCIGISNFYISLKVQFYLDFQFLDSLENWAASRDAAICSICPLLLFDSWLHALSTSQTLKCAEIWPKIFWLSQFVLDKFLGNNQLQNFFQSSSSDSNLNEVMIPCQELFSSSTTSSSISRRTTQVFFPDPISSKSLKRSLATSGQSPNWKRTR